MSDRVKITKTVFDRAEPRAERYAIMDSEFSGFGLRVEPSGKKTFFIRYRAGDGGRNAPQRLMTIKQGTLTVEQVRGEAKRLLGIVAAGGDPAGDRSTERAAETINDLIDLYERDGLFVQRGVRQGEPMKETTAAYTIARLRHHVVPLLGKRKAKDISPGDIERFVRDVTGGKTARDEKIKGEDGKTRRIIVRGGEGAARKVARDLSAVFSFAKRRRIVTANPCEDAAIRKTDNRNELFLTLDQLGALGRAIAELEAEGMNPKAGNIVRLWALTGCRRNEIAGLKWAEVDIASGLLRFEDTKTGKSLRPLGAVAAQILAGIERQEDSPFVFPAESGNGFFTGTKMLWPEIRRRAKLPEGASPHTLRHSLGAAAASSGESLLITGSLLGHANPRSTSIYAHVAQDPSRRAADRVANQIGAAMKGAREAQVIPLKR